VELVRELEHPVLAVLPPQEGSIMKQRNVWLLILSVVLSISLSSATWASGYRLFQLNDEGDSREVIATDLNNRGEVVGSRSNGSGGPLSAFRWSNGEFIDVHAVVGPNSNFTQAAGVNDLSTIVGFRSGTNFEGFVLRGTRVTPLRVVDGERHVFPHDINNRGQIIADSIGGPESGSFFVDRGQAELLPGLPGSLNTMVPAALNDRGTVLGNVQTPSGTRSVLWRNGTIIDLGFTAGANMSFGRDVNNRDQAVGSVNFPDSTAAFIWQNGTMTLLPPLPPIAGRSSDASSINDIGVVAGQTAQQVPTGLERTATLWFGGQVIDLNTLIHVDDPLRPFVHLEYIEEINNRGDILATGIDSRQPTVMFTYFLTLFDE
jgi:probable HAF family extracellular repeat protein